jgi:hypothetical protein
MNFGSILNNSETFIGRVPSMTKKTKNEEYYKTIVKLKAHPLFFICCRRSSTLKHVKKSEEKKNDEMKSVKVFSVVSNRIF